MRRYKWTGVGERLKFDIFTSAADRERTVVALGERYNTGILPTDEDGWAVVGCDWSEVAAGYKTYIEAVAAAVEAVSDE